MAFVYISTYNRWLSYILVHIIDVAYIRTNNMAVVHIISYYRNISYILVHIIDGFRIY